MLARKVFEINIDKQDSINGKECVKQYFSKVLANYITENIELSKSIAFKVDSEVNVDFLINTVTHRLYIQEIPINIQKINIPEKKEIAIEELGVKLGIKDRLKILFKGKLK